MGIIEAIIPATKITRSVKRVKVTSENIAAVGRMYIKNFMSELDTLHSMCYERLPDPSTKEPHTRTDLIWKASLLMEIPYPSGLGICR